MFVTRLLLLLPPLALTLAGLARAEQMPGSSGRGIGCNEPGKCNPGSRLIRSDRSRRDYTDCLAECHGYNGCNHVTWTGSVCELYSSCNGVSQRLCPQCISGDVECRESGGRPGGSGGHSGNHGGHGGGGSGGYGGGNDGPGYNNGRYGETGGGSGGYGGGRDGAGYNNGRYGDNGGSGGYDGGSSSQSLSIGCDKPKECIGSRPIVERQTVLNLDHCYDLCDAQANCNFVTHYENSRECSLFRECPSLHHCQYDRCVSGELSCREQDDQACRRPSECELGLRVDLEKGVDSYEDCLAFCQGHRRCQFFTYFHAGKTCIGYESCQRFTACNGCLSGKRSCSVSDGEGNTGAAHSPLGLLLMVSCCFLLKFNMQ